MPLMQPPPPGPLAPGDETDILDPPVPAAVLLPPPPQPAHASAVLGEASCLSCGHGHASHQMAAPHVCLSPACACAAWHEPRQEAPFVLSEWKDQLLLLVDQAMWKYGEHVIAGMRTQEQHLQGMIQTLGAQQSGVQALAASVGAYAPVVPYSVAIAVISPGGFPMTFTVQERSQDAFLTAVGAVMAMLRDDGFTPMVLPMSGA